MQIEQRLILFLFMKKKWNFIQEATRVYTFYSPLRKGKYRLASLATNLADEIPQEILTTTKDGRKLICNPAPHYYQTVYFLGEYERAVTDVISKVVQRGDVCLDVGANIGWYTTLLQKLVREEGTVYAFEPVPKAFSLLEKNVKLNSAFDNIYLYNLALGDSEKEAEMHIFDGFTEGHASLASFVNRSYKISPTRMIILDTFLEANNIGEINFVKIDIEGAELLMLKGAKRLFNQIVPPIFVIEMALGTTEGFGYLPNDIIEFIAEKRDYEFYAIDESKFLLKKIKNVLCVPKGKYQDRLAKLTIIN
ncbi:MAG: FkbM family methyltransferase [Acidobacteria bacterium]|nr:FkbM family methyltransferase [Acidobacteriota bacterium]